MVQDPGPKLTPVLKDADINFADPDHLIIKVLDKGYVKPRLCIRKIKCSVVLPDNIK